MRIRRHPEAFHPWVQSVSAYIGDPVRRLRFLRAVAPIVAPRKRPLWVRLGRTLLVLLALAMGLIATFHPRAAAGPASEEAISPPPPSHGVPRAGRVTEVWQVETRNHAEVYSNGLQIDDRYTVSHRPRSYVAFPLGGGAAVERTEPTGIVFHSTESMQAPFEAGHNDTLKRIGESLLDYVRRRRSYHFVIDRFGRVYRVVAESDAANHAGHSAWADDRWLYLELNDSFFGVAFEAQAGAEITTAQVRSAASLTEMLRSRYGIDGRNCVTHAQVSVNPSNMRIGYHVDWATGLPFAELGLPDNYSVALPSIWALGFQCAPGFLNAGASAASEKLRQAPADRKELQRRYREMLAVARRGG